MSVIQPLLEMTDVGKIYKKDENQVVAIDEVTIRINKGERCAILGPSGSGKSTLLSLLGLLDQPTRGRYLFDGIDVSKMNGDTRASLRNNHIGFIFQGFNLLPTLTALENVALPLFYRGLPKPEAHKRARYQLDQIGLGERLHFRPASLSGGQCQRVAIARALVGKPDLILADEPTGNLDSTNAEEIFNLLLKLNNLYQVTLVIVTHDNTLAERMDRKIYVKNGKVL